MTPPIIERMHFAPDDYIRGIRTATLWLGAAYRVRKSQIRRRRRFAVVNRVRRGESPRCIHRGRNGDLRMTPQFRGRLTLLFHRSNPRLSRLRRISDGARQRRVLGLNLEPRTQHPRPEFDMIVDCWWAFGKTKNQLSVVGDQ